MSAIPAEAAPAATIPPQAAASGETRIAGPLGALLPHLLHEMGWQRSDRVLRSAVPAQGPLPLAGFVQVLRRLGLEVTVGETTPERWDTGIDAALVRVAADGAAEARVRRSGVTTRVLPHGPADADTPEIQPKHQVLVIDTSDAAVRQPDPTAAWTPTLRRVTRRAFVLSFFINLLALSVPIFSMQIYDRVIGGNAPEVLPWFALGTAIAIGFMLVLRRQRSRLLAGAYARMGYHLSLAVQDRMLRLPLLVAGKLRRAGLTSRARELERVRGRLGAANIVAVFDAPFILLSLFAVVFVGGWLVLIPVAYLLLFAVAARWMTGYVAAGARLAGPAIAEREAMLADLAEHAPALLATRAAEGWTRRFLEVSANAVRGGYAQGARQGLAQAAAYVLGTGAALATLVGGLELVLAGAMTPGGLIASMLLIWRITAPAQALFLAEGRLRQAGAAQPQVERFFATPYDGSDAGKRLPADIDAPSLTFERVTFRYNSDQEPALAGVSFLIEPGEVLAVVGPNGAGKSTVLRLAGGLLEPQGGLVLIGDRNIRQFDPEDLHLAIGSYPEHPATFSGTLADNLRSAVPGVAEDEMSEAVAGAGAGALGGPLCQGVGPRLPMAGSGGRAGVGEGRRGRATLVIAPPNPALMALADKALVLDKGQGVHFGPLEKPDPAADTDPTGSPS